MKRVLTFDPSNPRSGKRFDLCRTAVLNAGDQKGPRDRATIRSEARLQDALDAVSEPWPDAEPNPEGKERRLKADGGQLTLSQEDHTLLTKYLDTTPWLPRAARDAVDVQDFAGAADKVEE